MCGGLETCFLEANRERCFEIWFYKLFYQFYQRWETKAEAEQCQIALPELFHGKPSSGYFWEHLLLLSLFLLFASWGKKILMPCDFLFLWNYLAFQPLVTILLLPEGQKSGPSLSVFVEVLSGSLSSRWMIVTVRCGKGKAIIMKQKEGREWYPTEGIGK